MLARRTLANAIRALSMDAVQKANSGHPGMPMGMADIAEVLWNDFLNHHPANPKWPNRDRFVLSNGHGSMLLYALLHLSGYDVSIEDIKQFRQLHSKTPGHPEFADTPGVETTTGPLGQGLANAVGMALAERHMAARYNQANFDIINHFTYTFVGDGCLMEGISHEACSLAGTLGLGKLIVFYDDNGISIDGKVASWFSDNTPERFRAYGWQVIEQVDGHDGEQIKQAIEAARANASQPTLICCKTTIGWGSPNLAGSEKSHGSPLGDEEIAAARQQLQWPHAAFDIPADIKTAWDANERGQQLEQTWQTAFNAYQKQYPELANELNRRLQGQLPENWSQVVKDWQQQCASSTDKMATRKASLQCLNAYAPQLPELLGGSADLTGSNCTRWQAATTLDKENLAGNYLYYGVREFGMSAIMNGLALYGGIIPFGGTFLTFSDYARNAIRMAALMNQGSIFVYTHDSIGLGEDGPTHQPIEHLTMLRTTPNVDVWRPCDLMESAVAWQVAIENRSGPSCLCFSRQGLPEIQRDNTTIDNIKRGGYILRDCEGEPDVIIIATGSEVQLALAAYDQLQGRKNIRLVSMPSCERFDQQDESYRQQVLPNSCRNRIAIEAGSTTSWYRYVGLDGKILGLDQFGLSAPAEQIYDEFQLTTTHLLSLIEKGDN